MGEVTQQNRAAGHGREASQPTGPSAKRESEARAAQARNDMVGSKTTEWERTHKKP